MNKEVSVELSKIQLNAFNLLSGENLPFSVWDSYSLEQRIALFTDELNRKAWAVFDNNENMSIMLGTCQEEILVDETILYVRLATKEDIDFCKSNGCIIPEFAENYIVPEEEKPRKKKRKKKK